MHIKSSFENGIKNIFMNHIYLIYMYKQDLDSNNLPGPQYPTTYTNKKRILRVLRPMKKLAKINALNAKKCILNQLTIDSWFTYREIQLQSQYFIVQKIIHCLFPSVSILEHG